MTYHAKPPKFPSVSDDWTVEREYMCINGVRCWFVIATVEEPGEAEMGYMDGAIGTAQERATHIATALNAAETR